MSKIAQRLTGLSQIELFNTDLRTIHAAAEVYGLERCRDVRIFSSMITGPGDLNKERERLRNSTPQALKHM